MPSYLQMDVRSAVAQRLGIEGMLGRDSPDPQCCVLGLDTLSIASNGSTQETRKSSKHN